MKIAVDVMGSDNGPATIMDGFALAFQDLSHENFVLVGDQAIIKQELLRLGLDQKENISIVHANQVVEMTDPSTAALRTKKDSSVTIAAELMKSREVDAFLSSGHTGAAVAASVVKVRNLPGIERPGIATVFPTPTGPFVLLDAGANVDSKPIHLVQFALMGQIHAVEVLGIENPRIGLLSNGEEKSKGNELSKSTAKVLKELPINYIGYIEGSDLFKGKADVVVCDGFVGNVVLKTCEGLAKSLGATLKELLMKNPVRKAGAALSQGAFKEFKEMVDHEEYGGAPLLGINGTCIISHGSSSKKAIKNAIFVARDFVDHDVNNLIVDSWEEHEATVRDILGA